MNDVWDLVIGFWLLILIGHFFDNLCIIQSIFSNQYYSEIVTIVQGVNSVIYLFWVLIRLIFSCEHHKFYIILFWASYIYWILTFLSMLLYSGSNSLGVVLVYFINIFLLVLYLRYAVIRLNFVCIFLTMFHTDRFIGFGVSCVLFNNRFLGQISVWKFLFCRRLLRPA